jgi:N-acetylmuramoyl-L-alanine amidase
MGNKWIWSLLGVFAVNSLLAQQPALGQEKRKSYTLPQKMRSDAISQAPAAGIATKTADIERGPDGPVPAAAVEKPVVRGLQLVSSQNSIRVILDVSRQVRYEVHRLPPDPARGLPPRIYIDFFGASLAMDGKEPIKVDDGLLRQIRMAQFSTDVVRAVLDTTSVKEYSIFQLTDPYRVVIEVQGQESAETLANVERSRPSVPPAENRKQKNNDAVVASIETPKPAPSPVKETKPGMKESKPALPGLRKIVLDPGHGGKDPGAVGVDGIAEKDIVLKVAKKLAQKLTKDLGVQVVLTRKDDRFIRLEDRTAIANAEDADLFISLHMNASPSGEAKGLETYYLDNTTDEASIRLAERENATSRNNVSDLQFILSDMTQNMKLEDSVTLAHRLHESLLGSVTHRNVGTKDLGVKKALFSVLVGARMPSVLLEMFFITNKAEGRAMNQDSYQDAVVDALYEGIQKYGESVIAAKTL